MRVSTVLHPAGGIAIDLDCTGNPSFKTQHLIKFPMTLVKGTKVKATVFVLLTTLFTPKSESLFSVLILMTEQDAASDGIFLQEKGKTFPKPAS